MNTKFKIGDWVIHGFALKQITRVEGIYLTASDGYFSTSGQLECREATNETKRLADDCRYYYDQLSKEFSRVINNWPDLNRWFEAHCLKMIDARKDETRIKALYAELQQMHDSIVEACNNSKNIEVGGVKLFSRR